MTVDHPVPEQGRSSAWLQTVGLAALEAIPLLGAPTASLISEGMRQVAREKDEEWAAMVLARLHALERDGVPVDTNNPEFIAALRRLAAAASETADRDKLQLLARAASNAGPWSSTDLADREEYIALTTFESFAEELDGDRSLAHRLLIALQQRGLFGSPLPSSPGTGAIEITRFGVGLIEFLRDSDPRGV